MAPALLAVAAIAIAAHTAPGAAGGPVVAEHHEARLAGLAGTPAWWAWSDNDGIDGTTRFDVGPLPAGVVVRVVAEAVTPGTTFHLYVQQPSSGLPWIAPAADPLPGVTKSVTVAGPGTRTILVDPGPSLLYRIHVAFDGYHGDASTGERAAFPLTALGTYRCPVAPVGACPP